MARRVALRRAREAKVTYYIVATPDVHIAGITAHPTQERMMQVARNVTMEDVGFVRPGDYVIHDRDTKYSAAFARLLEDAGANDVPLPPRSPNLNAHTERWVLSAKSECLNHLILFGEGMLRRAMNDYVIHYCTERNHQGVGNVILFPTSRPIAASHPVQRHERLGGLLSSTTGSLWQRDGGRNRSGTTPRKGS